MPWYTFKLTSLLYWHQRRRTAMPLQHQHQQIDPRRPFLDTHEHTYFNMVTRQPLDPTIWGWLAVDWIEPRNGLLVPDIRTLSSRTTRWIPLKCVATQQIEGNFESFTTTSYQWLVYIFRSGCRPSTWGRLRVGRIFAQRWTTIMSNVCPDLTKPASINSGVMILQVTPNTLALVRAWYEIQVRSPICIGGADQLALLSAILQRQVNAKDDCTFSQNTTNASWWKFASHVFPESNCPNISQFHPSIRSRICGMVGVRSLVINPSSARNAFSTKSPARKETLSFFTIEKYPDGLSHHCKEESTIYASNGGTLPTTHYREN